MNVVKCLCMYRCTARVQSCVSVCECVCCCGEAAVVKADSLLVDGCWYESKAPVLSWQAGKLVDH